MLLIDAPMSPQREDIIPTRYSLLSRLQNWDDQESWKDFFDTYWRLIYNVAVRSGLSDAEAQDVVQETVICVAKDIQKFKRERAKGSFKGWLRNLTRWRVQDQLRKRMPVQEQSGSPCEEMEPRESLEAPGNSPLEEMWDKEWKENLIEAAIERVKRQVKEEHFQMFDLYVTKKWSVGAVAQTFGVNPGQVYLAKHRIGSLIRKEVRRLEKDLV